MVSSPDLEPLVDAVADLRTRVAPMILARQERRLSGVTAGERLTTPQHLTLLALAGGPLSVSEVATATGVAVSTATRMLQSLARAGWVVRAEPCAGEDRRRRPVRLTPEGRGVMEEASDLLRGRIRGLLGHLDAADRQAIVGGLEALARALQQDERGSGPQASSAPSTSAPTRTTSELSHSQRSSTTIDASAP